MKSRGKGRRTTVKAAAAKVRGRGRGAIKNVGGGKKGGGFMGYNPVAHNPSVAPMPYGTF